MSKTDSHFCGEFALITFDSRDDGLDDTDFGGQFQLREATLFAIASIALAQGFAAEINGGELEAQTWGIESIVRGEKAPLDSILHQVVFQRPHYFYDEGGEKAPHGTHFRR